MFRAAQPALTSASAGPKSPPPSTPSLTFRFFFPFPIWYCTVEIRWRRWVICASIGISLSDWHGFGTLVNAEILYGN
uniref:Uncharacterized protein n=1 Tax=Fagus sylvatica TaxID=28930 RepID=A0A2N9HJF7_FAGSY